MRSAYISPIFWTNVFDRAVRTAAQFGLAFLLSILGESATTGFSSADINILDLTLWMLSGLIVSVLTSLAFPKKVLNVLEEEDEEEEPENNHPV